MKAVISNSLLASLKPEARPFEVRDTRLKGLLLRVQPTGIMSYYVEYARGKRMQIGRADAVTPAQARENAKDILSEVYAGRDPMEARRRERAHTFSSFVDEIYKPWADANIRTAKKTVGRLKANFPDLQEKKLGDINPWLIEKWRTARFKSGVKRTTVNRDLDDLKSALAKAVEWGHLDTNPIASVKRSRVDDNPTPRFLTNAEMDDLLEALDVREEKLRSERESANVWRRERDYPLLRDLRSVPFADHLKPMVLISLHTGVRRGELFSLEWSEVRLPELLLTVRGTKAKSMRTRHLPLNEVARKTLEDWQSQSPSTDGLVFVNKEGKQYDNVNSAWRRILKDAKVESFRWHDLRHTFASHLVMGGVDLNTVRELLGHADLQMTLRYAHLAPEHKAAAVAQLVRG